MNLRDLGSKDTILSWSAAFFLEILGWEINALFQGSGEHYLSIYLQLLRQSYMIII